MSESIILNLNIIQGEEEIIEEEDTSAPKEIEDSGNLILYDTNNLVYIGHHLKYNPREKNDFCCWWCCHTFQNPPVLLPEHYDVKKDLFRVSGNFCSFSCAKAYDNANRPPFRKGGASLLDFFYKRCSGSKKTVQPAPPRLTLKMFGGPLTIEEFRKRNGEDFKFIPYPCVPVATQIQEVKWIQKENRVPKNKELAIRRSQGNIKSGNGLSLLGIKTIKKSS